MKKIAAFLVLSLVSSLLIAQQTTGVIDLSRIGDKHWKTPGLPGAPHLLYDVSVNAGHIYYWNGSAWIDFALTGPTGAKGDKGDVGTKGDKGDTGNTGLTGGTGLQGIPGLDGKTVRSGNGVPASNLGIDGDFYINLLTYDIYGPKTGGAWGSATSLKGLKGDKGDTGNTGAIGANGSNGTNGTNGTNGINGTTWYAGTIVPSNATGVNGDLYFRSSTGDVYLKSSGTWSIVANITGPQGAPGTNGINGNNGTNGSNGAPGAAATISVGSTTTGNSGTSASVSNSGSSSTAVFNFTIPRGDVGAAGVNGTNGTNGSNGASGATGPAGPAPSGAANLILATPDGTSGVSALRTMVTADVPVLPYLSNASGVTIPASNTLQTANLRGGSASAGNFHIYTTSNATKGLFIFDDLFAIAYDSGDGISFLTTGGSPEFINAFGIGGPQTRGAAFAFKLFDNGGKGQLILTSNGHLSFTAGADTNQTQDTIITRNAAGVVSFDTTTDGNGLGTARATAVQFVCGSLGLTCTSGVKGKVYCASDGSLCNCNGTTWTPSPLTGSCN